MKKYEVYGHAGLDGIAPLLGFVHALDRGDAKELACQLYGWDKVEYVVESRF